MGKRKLTALEQMGLNNGYASDSAYDLQNGINKPIYGNLNLGMKNPYYFGTNINTETLQLERPTDYLHKCLS